MIATRHNLALDYRQQKHFAEAERAFRECIDEVALIMLHTFISFHCFKYLNHVQFISITTTVY